MIKMNTDLHRFGLKFEKIRVNLLQNTAKQDLPVSQLERRWLAACMAAVCVQLVGNLFLFDVAATAVVFWLLLAIVTAATTPPAKETATFTLPHQLGKVMVVVSPNYKVSGGFLFPIGQGAGVTQKLWLPLISSN